MTILTLKIVLLHNSLPTNVKNFDNYNNQNLPKTMPVIWEKNSLIAGYLPGSVPSNILDTIYAIY